MYIDTHAHLYLEQFDDDRDAVMQATLDAGVKKVYLPNIDHASFEAMLAMERDYPGVCFPMVGIHPCSVVGDYQSQVDWVAEQLEERSWSAVGEIGTDMYWDKTLKQEQERAFRKQIELAKAYELPIVIHSRETLDWNISIVREMQDGSLRGVFHCFNGTVEQGSEIAELGFFMGLGGVVTFKNGGMDKVVPHLKKEWCVLETDAPFLTPTPHRGKRNTSEYIPLVAQKVADFWEMPVAEVRELTTSNAQRLFG